jgi:hypothetical protein
MCMLFKKICSLCSDVWIKPEINAFQDNGITENLCYYCNIDHMKSFHGIHK